MNIYHHLGRDDEAEEAHEWVIELDENEDAIEEYVEKRRLAQRVLR